MNFAKRHDCSSKVYLAISIILVAYQGAALAQEQGADNAPVLNTRQETRLKCVGTPCFKGRTNPKDPEIASWFRGGIIVSPQALGEWGLLEFGLGTTSETGDRYGVGANIIVDGGRKTLSGLGSDDSNIWGAHFSYDAVVGSPSPVHFYSHFELGFLVEAGDPNESRTNKVRPAITTGLGLELLQPFGTTSVRFGPEFGYHWALSAPYALLQIGIDG